MGHKFKCLGKLSNGWTDWHQIWYKSADSSGNGHRLNTIRPSIPQGVLGGHTFKSLGKLSNNWTDCHQIWYASADSSGYGHGLNTFRPSITQGAFWVVLGGHKFKSLLKPSHGWTDWHPILHTCADSSGNGYTPNKLPFETKGGHLGILGGQTFKSVENLSNGWTDWHQLWFTSADSSGNRHLLNKFKRAFFSTRPSDRAHIWHACADRDETGSHQEKLTNPTPEGFRGLFMFVGCGMFVA